MKKALIAPIFFIYICSSPFAQSILDGVWAHESNFINNAESNNKTQEFFYENYSHGLRYKDFSWGKGKDDDYFSIDIENKYFSYYRQWDITSLEKITEKSYCIEFTGDINSKWRNKIEVEFLDYDTIILKNQLIKSTGIQENVPLVRISGPARIFEKKVIINDNKVRLRMKPNLDYPEWGFLNKGDIVTIKELTKEKYEINAEKWYWYKVDSPNYPDGWVYGKYLDMNGDKYSTHKVFTFEIPQPENNSVVIIRSMNFIFFDKYAKKVKSHKNEYQRYLSEQLRKYSFEDILCNKFEIQEKLKENINKDFGLKIEYVTFGRVELEHR